MHWLASVHIVTVNDYLAETGMERSIFEWLGLTVDCIDKQTKAKPGEKPIMQISLTERIMNLASTTCATIWFIHPMKWFSESTILPWSMKWTVY
jgi:hypothetical protein